MTMYTNEQEEWQAIKAWWKVNGKWTIVILVVTLTLGFSLQYWQKYKLQRSNHASILYTQLLDSLQFKRWDLFEKTANDLEKNYAQTPYATLASLFQAEQATGKGNLALAQEKLQWASQHSPSASLRQIAQLRTARILLAQGHLDQAMDALAKVDDKAFLPGINQIKADIYLAQGNKAKARQAYEAALKDLSGTDPMRIYLQMQVNQLQG